MKITQFTPNIYGLYKPAGWTPLQALFELKNVKPELRSTPLTYAGRLDPMAEGLLLVLAGDAVHEKDTYLGLDKEYRVTALLGVQTDSFDLLGIPSRIMPHLPPTLGEEEIQQTLQSYAGETSLPLPIYSSPPYKGKPLHAWAQAKGIQAEDTPERQTTIHAMTDTAVGELSAIDILKYITHTIPKVDGSFRQDEIINAWHELLAREPHKSIPTLSITVRCSSGTYIRSLVNEIGKNLGIGACVYTLTRTKVGDYAI